MRNVASNSYSQRLASEWDAAHTRRNVAALALSACVSWVGSSHRYFPRLPPPPPVQIGGACVVDHTTASHGFLPHGGMVRT